MARVIALALLCFALLAAAAQAQTTNAPPGNSGVDEYLESVPGSTGNTPSRDGGSNSSPGATLSAAARKSLAAQGPDGKAAAALAEKYGVSRAQRVKPARPSSTSGSKRPTTSSDAPKGRSVASSLSSAVLPSGSAGGLGPALPIILASTAVLGAGVVLIRRARPH
jgi:hypothetical protein